MHVIHCPNAMMVLSLVAVAVGNDHPIVRSDRHYNDLFIVGSPYGRSDLSYEQTDSVVCHTETIL